MGETRNLLQEWLGTRYVAVGRRIWWRLPARIQKCLLGRWYGLHLHAVVRRSVARRQNHSTFFFRNRAELELLGRLVDERNHGARLRIAVVGCSNGAEVYSIVWAIRSGRPDLKLRVHAVDISQSILEFARRGVYSLKSPDLVETTGRGNRTEDERLAWNTYRDQDLTIFGRMSEAEIEAMFDREGDQLNVKSWLRPGIFWHRGSAEDDGLMLTIGRQDVVVANRFLCHMEPAAAERCLRNLARLVRPGGYLFASGVDLDVRARIAREMGWLPVTDLIEEIHEGDRTLRDSWPTQYWAQEPFRARIRDWARRYASVFRVGVNTCLAFVAW
jgi:chemotaxis methyl-accepting protein methylase